MSDELLRRAREFLSRGFAEDEPEPNRRTTRQANRNISQQANRDIPGQFTEPPDNDEAARIAAKMSREGQEIVAEADRRLAAGGPEAEGLPEHLPADLLARTGRLDPKDQRRLARWVGLRVKQAVQRRRG